MNYETCILENLLKEIHLKLHELRIKECRFGLVLNVDDEALQHVPWKAVAMSDVVIYVDPKTLKTKILKNRYGNKGIAEEKI